MTDATTSNRRWYPGYNVAAVATLAYLASAPGQTFIVSQLNAPLSSTFDIEPLTLNTSYTIATVTASLPLVLAGSLTDRIGARWAIVLIAFCFGLGCLVMAGAPNFVVVCLGFFLMRFLGMGALTMVSQHAVAMWFHRKLGLITGIKTSVVCALWIAFPQIALRLIDSVGWRWTYVIFACFIWLSVIPLALLWVRNKPEDIGLRLDGDQREAAQGQDAAATTAPAPPEPAYTLKQAMRTRAYWTIVAAVFPAPLIGTAILFDIQPILAGRGMDQYDAANVVSAWTASMAIMSLPSGWLTDHVRPSWLLTIGGLLIALSVITIWSAKAPLQAMAGMALFGIGQSTIASSSNATLARYFGRRGHGAIRSSIMRIGVLATGLGPLITALSIKFTESYSSAMIVFIALCAPAMALTMSLRPPPDSES